MQQGEKKNKPSTPTCWINRHRDVFEAECVTSVSKKQVRENLWKSATRLMPSGKKKKNAKRVQTDALPPSLQLAGEVFYFNLSFGANGNRHQLEMSFDTSCSQMQKTPRMKNGTGEAFRSRMHGYVENIMHTVNTTQDVLAIGKIIGLIVAIMHHENTDAQYKLAV